VELELSASIRGRLYALTSKRGQWPCSAQSIDDPTTTTVDEQSPDPDRCFSQLSHSRGSIGPSLSVRLASSVWFSVDAGFVFYRRYEFMADGGSTTAGNLDLSPNVIVQAKLELRVPSS
jgi:hypothetical protein